MSFSRVGPNQTIERGQFKVAKSLLAKTVTALTGKAPGVYVTLNPVRPELLARAENRVIEYAKNTTTDDNIIFRNWLLIDFDPVRPAGISSTEAEHNAAITRALETRAGMAKEGWPEPILADSGNGAHLLYRIALPNDVKSRELIKHCLEFFFLHFGDHLVGVDLSTYNAGRICKVYGTLAAKGDSTKERPHRISRLLEVPSEIKSVERGLLENLAAQLPAPSVETPQGLRKFNLVAWITKHNFSIVAEGDWQGGHKWIFSACPWNPDHKNRSAYIVRLPNGAISAGCLHQSCANKDWYALRDLVEPGWRSQKSGEHEWPSSLPSGSSLESGIPKRSQATRLIALAADAELFCTPDGSPYATVPIGFHRETWSMKSSVFRQYLARKFYESERGAPTAQAVNDAAGILCAKAQFDGHRRPVFIRVAEHEGDLYLDLADTEWRVVKITRRGWRIVNDPPIHFRRARGMMPLPEPATGGSITDLRPFLNLQGDDDWALLSAWTVATLRPRGPYPILVVHGEQGSTKSTTVRVLRSLIDPFKAPLRSAPRNERDLVITANNSHIIALDNMSHVEPWLSDALCRLATGGGLATRELYTNDEEIIFEGQRPIILNGIENLGTRGDYLERSLRIRLPHVPETSRREEEEYWASFAAARPGILGALLGAASAALSNRDSVKLEKKPRMADFVVWATAAEPALGLTPGSFMLAYTANLEATNHLALESSPVAYEICRLLGGTRSWLGTAGKLLNDLDAQAGDELRKQKEWPKTARGLSGVLQRLAPNLRALGVFITPLQREAGSGRRLIRLEYRRDSGSQPSQAGNKRTHVTAQPPHLPSQPSPSSHICSLEKLTCDGCDGEK